MSAFRQLGEDIGEKRVPECAEVHDLRGKTKYRVNRAIHDAAGRDLPPRTRWIAAIWEIASASAVTDWQQSQDRSPLTVKAQISHETRDLVANAAPANLPANRQSKDVLD